MKFYLSLLWLDLTSEKEDLLLKMLVEHSVTVWSFFFINMKLYKNLQRSKGFRTKLCVDETKLRVN